MKLSEPIGNGLWAAFFVRMTLGGYFVMAGLAKLDALPAFMQEVQNFRMLPPHLAQLYALLIPYIEIACGALLVLGIWTILGAVIAVLVLVSFVAAFGIFPPGTGRHLFNKDIILLAAAISLLFSGAGALSIDRFRKAG